MTDSQKEVQDELDEVSRQNATELKRANALVEELDQLIDKSKDAIEEIRTVLTKLKNFKKIARLN